TESTWSSRTAARCACSSCSPTDGSPRKRRDASVRLETRCLGALTAAASCYHERVCDLQLRKTLHLRAPLRTVPGTVSSGARTCPSSYGAQAPVETRPLAPASALRTTAVGTP